MLRITFKYSTILIGLQYFSFSFHLVRHYKNATLAEPKKYGSFAIAITKATFDNKISRIVQFFRNSITIFDFFENRLDLQEL